MNCGNCKICCYVTAVPEIQKHFNTWCAHAIGSQGCRIYAMRPLSCCGFECYWLKEGLSKDLRPDLCGVMIESIPGYNVRVVYCDPSKPMAWQQPEFRKIIADFALSNHPVVVNVGRKGGNVIILPDGITEDQVWSELNELNEKAMGV